MRQVQFQPPPQRRPDAPCPSCHGEQEDREALVPGRALPKAIDRADRIERFLEARGVPVYRVEEVPAGHRDQFVPDGVAAMTVTVGDGRQAIILGSTATYGCLLHEAAHVLLRHAERYPHSSPRDRGAYLADPAETEAEATARIVLGEAVDRDFSGVIDPDLVTEAVMALQAVLS